MTEPLTQSYMDDHPPSEKVQKLMRAGKNKEAIAQYRIELVATMMGISETQYRRTYGHFIEDERKKRRSAQVVYVIARSSYPAYGDPVKIGIAVDVQKRLAGFQTGSPEKLHLIATISGDKEFERSMHRRFRDDHIRGEWFTWSPTLEKFVAKRRRDPELDEL